MSDMLLSMAMSGGVGIVEDVGGTGELEELVKAFGRKEGADDTAYGRCRIRYGRNHQPSFVLSEL